MVGSVENYVLLMPDGAEGPKLLLQCVPEHKADKNRMHFDLEVPDIEGVASRLEQLGATRLSEHPMAEHDSHWIVMADPEGNEFCVCQAGARDGDARPDGRATTSSPSTIFRPATGTSSTTPPASTLLHTPRT